MPAIAGEPRELLKMSVVDVEVGTGAPALSGKRYKVHYTGWLRDGTEFDSSRGRDPMTFTLGEGRVIAGFDSAVTGMAIGEQKTVVIPAADAYGEPRESMDSQILAGLVSP